MPLTLQKAQPRDRNDAFTRRIAAKQIGDARLAIQQPRMLLRTRGIFVPVELIKKFQVFLDVPSRGTSPARVEFQHQTSLEAQDTNHLQLFTDLGNAVRDRLLIVTEE